MWLDNELNIKIPIKGPKYQRIVGDKYNGFDIDVENTVNVIREKMLLLLSKKDDQIIKQIAEEIRLLYPSYNIDVAISKYYDDIVMGGGRWETSLTAEDCEV